VVTFPPATGAKGREIESRQGIGWQLFKGYFFKWNNLTKFFFKKATISGDVWNMDVFSKAFLVPLTGAHCHRIT
jgi:hypothetical protein